MHGLGFFKHVLWGGAPFFKKNGEEKAPPRLSFRKEELKERTPAHSHRSILRARYCGMPCSAPGTAPGDQTGKGSYGNWKRHAGGRGSMVVERAHCAEDPVGWIGGAAPR
jgi:hypothetical protein